MKYVFDGIPAIVIAILLLIVVFALGFYGIYLISDKDYGPGLLAFLGSLFILLNCFKIEK